MRPRSELAVRTLSGLVLGAAVLFVTWWNPISFDTMCALGLIILAREWWGLTGARSIWFIPLGLLYLGGGVLSLMFIRMTGLHATYVFFALVWGGDIGAYIVGKTIGKHKIAPSISPGKSWEGLAGSVLATTAIAATHAPLVTAIIVGCVFAIVGLSGDLFESALKRRAGVKDSGRLIPGHGGLFDRVDALLPCAIVTALFLLFAANWPR